MNLSITTEDACRTAPFPSVPVDDRFRRLVENASDLIYMCDMEGRLTYVNQSAARTVGRSKSELIGRPCLTFVRPDHQARVRRAYQRQLVERTRSTYIEFPAVTAAGDTLWLGQEVQLVYERHALLGFQAIARDITVQKSSELRMRALQERLSQAEKLEAVGRQAGSVAHDFNNLLTAILGMTELLLDEATASASMQEDLREIQNVARRAAALTQQLLTLSRNEESAAETVDVNQAVASLEPMLRGLLHEDVVLTCDRPDRPTPVWIDPKQTEQLILNLVLIAQDALPAGGHIDVELSAVEIAPRPNRASGETLAAGHYARLRVSDDGAGIAPGKDTGPDLAAVNRTVQRYGGTIAVESEAGHGTTFTIHFPLDGISGDAAPPASREIPRSTDGTPRASTILLLDDEEAIRQVAGAALRKRGYQVIEATTPQAAIELFDRYRDSIDMLVTDVVMPDLSGPAVAQRLVARRAALRVLFMTGHGATGHPIKHNRVRFVAKPFRSAALVAAVDETLRPRAGVH